MSLRDALAIIWRRRFVVLLIAAVGLVASWVLGQSFRASEPLYQADATLSLNVGEDPKSVVGLVHVASQTTEIYDLVFDDLGDDVPGVVEIEALPDIGFIAIYASGQPDELTAEEVVASYVRHIVGYATSNRTEARDDRLATLTERAESLEADLAALDRQQDALAEGQEDAIIEARIEGAANALAGVTREISDLAAQTDADLAPLGQVGEIAVQAETVAVDPLGATSRALLGVGLGLLLGAGLALALHRFDTRLFNRRDAEAAYRLPVLAEVPRISWRHRRPGRIMVRAMPAAKASEAYRVLRTAIARARTLQLAERGPDAGSESHLGAVVLVTSVSSAVGKSTTVANLAVACVDAGSKVLVVSADLRQPSIHEYFGADGTLAGLTDAAREFRARPEAPVELSRYLRSTSVEGVSLLLHGSPVTSPGEALAGARQLVESARSRFDIIIVDSPPMLAGNDVDELLWSADLVVQVARAGRTTIEEGQWSDEMAQRRPADTCGLVLIGSSSELERRSAARRNGWKARLASMFGRGVRPVLSSRDAVPTLDPVGGRASVAGETSESPAGGTAVAAVSTTVPVTPISIVPPAPVSAVPAAPVSTVPAAPVNAVPAAPVSTVPPAPVSTAPVSTAPDQAWRAPVAASAAVTAQHPIVRADGPPPGQDAPGGAAEPASRPPSVWWAPVRPESNGTNGTNGHHDAAPNGNGVKPGDPNGVDHPETVNSASREPASGELAAEVGSVRPPAQPVKPVPPVAAPEPVQVPAAPGIEIEGADVVDRPSVDAEAAVSRPRAEHDLMDGLDDGLDDEDELGTGMVKLPSGRRPGDGDRSFST